MCKFRKISLILLITYYFLYTRLLSFFFRESGCFSDNFIYNLDPDGQTDETAFQSNFFQYDKMGKLTNPIMENHYLCQIILEIFV